MVLLSCRPLKWRVLPVMRKWASPLTINFQTGDIFEMVVKGKNRKVVFKFII